MNAEELLKDHLLPQDAQQNAQQDTKQKRLSGIVAEEGSRQFLGRELQLSDLDNMSPKNLDKLYCRYKARLGQSMTKTFGNSFINLYMMSVSKLYNVIDPP